MDFCMANIYKLGHNLRCSCGTCIGPHGTVYQIANVADELSSESLKNDTARALAKSWQRVLPSKEYRSLSNAIRDTVETCILKSLQPSTVIKTLREVEVAKSSLLGRFQPQAITKKGGAALLRVMEKLGQICQERFEEIIATDNSFQLWLTDVHGSCIGLKGAVEAGFQLLLDSLPKGNVEKCLAVFVRLAEIETPSPTALAAIEGWELHTVQFVAKRWLNLANDGVLHSVPAELLRKVAAAANITEKELLEVVKANHKRPVKRIIPGSAKKEKTN
ncbi:hypothetical protein HDV05_008482 [Chytridiales sp. JEL 0842]|nr:hypothetical protein HDV05_008482 [Chytridiales sp. JEL 0842]